MATPSTHRIVIPIYPDVELLDVAGPAEVFVQASRATGRAHYEVRYVSAQAGEPVPSSAGLPLGAEPLPTARTRIDTLLLPGADGEPLRQALDDARLMRWLERRVETTPRLASVCTGAFLLAAAGALDGRRATSHWFALPTFAERFPCVEVADDALWVRDEHVWTSAGVLSGVDLALAIVREDLGPEVALQVARYLVVYLVRDGAQSQFSAPVDLQARAARSDLSSLVAWLQTRLEAQTSVEAMAERMATSVRSLHRRCREVFDLTPAGLLAELRLEQARVLLQQGAEHLDAVAARCGYASQSALSRAFKQRFGIAPSHFRERFRQGADCSKARNREGSTA